MKQEGKIVFCREVRQGGSKGARLWLDSIVSILKGLAEREKAKLEIVVCETLGDAKANTIPGSILCFVSGSMSEEAKKVFEEQKSKVKVIVFTGSSNLPIPSLDILRKSMFLEISKGVLTDLESLKALFWKSE